HGAFNELHSRKRGQIKEEISLVSGFLDLCRKRKRVWLHNIQP
ncbi:unnamed protein product, partial [Brassica rapa]